LYIIIFVIVIVIIIINYKYNKGKLLYAGYSKPGNWLMNNIKENNEFTRYTSNNETIKPNIPNKESNINNYLNNFNDLTFMNNNWYSPYKTDIFNPNSHVEKKILNKDNDTLNAPNGNYRYKYNKNNNIINCDN